MSKLIVVFPVSSPQIKDDMSEAELAEFSEWWHNQISAEMAEQGPARTHYMPSEYPLEFCSRCGSAMYGWLDTVTGELVYECHKPYTEDNPSPHHLTLSIPTEQPKQIASKCNLEL